MHFNTNALVSIFAAASFATAKPLAKRADLQPWQLQYVYSFSPSGRPGSYPWLRIVANVTDPNELDLGTNSNNTEVILPAGGQALNCEAKWLPPNTPSNHFWPCDAAGDGYWTMEVVAPSDGKGLSTEDFDLKFTRVAQTISLGSSFTKKYAGQANFKVGGNMRGSCGGSGVCSWGLKGENTPYPIQQTEIS
ncbi:uncharacterized protein BDR25DRAFT_306465 [Lindgomyces ingoldianus]|uniref:Uncharacterized protein n=1 Tax=Lindgomyces ingoldianus TaxID=673940 RepID=A0ACB6QGL7_9PLEO|nr:uncharacterized protein BDR25DRAFT_306465 [Lindgomyces ingoldianus]KAF2466020.1 hypothetical protein BDR25DRAFT_306465 [Lindgomyces ingoldianus]